MPTRTGLLLPPALPRTVRQFLRRTPAMCGDPWLPFRTRTPPPPVFSQRVRLPQPPHSPPGLHRRSANLLLRARPPPAAWHRGTVRHRRAAYRRGSVQRPPRAPRPPPAVRLEPVPRPHKAHRQSRAVRRLPAAPPRRAPRPPQAHRPLRHPVQLQQRNRWPYRRRRPGNGRYSATLPRGSLKPPGQRYGNRPRHPARHLRRKPPPKTDSVLQPVGRSLKSLLRRVCRMCLSLPTTTFPSRMRNRRRKNGTPARTSSQGGRRSPCSHRRLPRPKHPRRPRQRPEPPRRRRLLFQLQPRRLTRLLHRIPTNP